MVNITFQRKLTHLGKSFIRLILYFRAAGAVVVEAHQRGIVAHQQGIVAHQRGIVVHQGRNAAHQIGIVAHQKGIVIYLRMNISE